MRRSYVCTVFGSKKVLKKNLEAVWQGLGVKLADIKDSIRLVAYLKLARYAETVNLGHL